MADPPHVNGYSGEDARIETLATLANTDLSRDAAITDLQREGSTLAPPATHEEAVLAFGIATERRRHDPPLFPENTPNGDQEGFSRLSRFSRNTEPWPEPVDRAARHGLTGWALDVIEPHSEADPHALLITLLVALGNAIGRGPGFQAEGDFHATNLYAAIVGRTAKGRKGTSWGRVKELLELIDPDYAHHRVMGGLSSGEGVIWQVRDAITVRRKAKKGDALPIDDDGYVEDTTDTGIDDKRLLIQEGEMAQALKVMRREGNTLSVTLRNLWDHGRQGALTKNSPARTTNALASMVGHITVDELRREMSETETANGFANRYLFVCAKRSKVLPDGGSLTSTDLETIAAVTRDALSFARRLKGPLYRDDQARDLWHEVYENLSEGRLGMLGAVTSRAEAQVMRLAVIYAVLDESTTVGLEHLQAALAVWSYCERSAAFIFGAALGDPVADEILRSLRSRMHTGMSRNDIANLFARNKGSERIGTALNLLLEHGLTRCEQIKTGGRPQERWYAVVDDEKSEINEKSPDRGDC